MRSRCRALLKPFGDARPKSVAARLEICELIERSAGRRKQHRGLARLRLPRILRRSLNGLVQGPVTLEGNSAGERAREFIARLADQIGFGNARKKRAQRLDAPRFRPAAENPVNVVERHERLLGRVGVGRFRNR